MNQDFFADAEDDEDIDLKNFIKEIYSCKILFDAVFTIHKTTFLEHMR